VIELAPLDMWQVQNLLPRSVTAAQARQVARQSRGNPFWALQISASLDAPDSQVPPLARTLTDRLSRSLTADAADALAVVAAAGRIGAAEAVAVLDHLPDPAAALDAAVMAGAVVETGDRLAVAHPLIGSAAVESLPPGRRLQLYRRLAQAASGAERYAHFAAVAAGPVGRHAEAATDLEMRAEIYAYSRSRGLFGGIAIEGAALSIDNEANTAFYGNAVSADEILSGRVKGPAYASGFTNLLQRYSTVPGR